MAIQIFCTNCKTSNGMDAGKCSKCGAVFGRSKKYRVVVSVKGRRATRVVDNLSIAREVEAALKGDLVRDEFDIADHRAKEAIILGDVWAEYLKWAKSNKKKSWMTDDFFYRKHLEPRFAKKALEEITPLDIERMKSEMKKTKTPQGKAGYSEATIRHQLVLLGHLFRKAREWNMFEGKSPTEAVKKPKLDNKITEFLSEDEMRRLSATLDSWPCRASANFVRISLFTGLRKSEIFKLQWDCVDLERKTITLKNPKGGITETIPISNQAVSVFGSIPKSSRFVIPGADGEMKKTFRDPWYKIRKAADLPASYRLHGLRHNFASQLVSSGVDLYTVSKLLTHKDVRTSERYAHLSNEALRLAAQKSGELLTPKPDQTQPELHVVK
ncbi:MAG: site-specific integrase [Desulfobacteraceae bacterium]|nr:site-specific integrase [Desulfobacteraceae bacterium]